MKMDRMASDAPSAELDGASKRGGHRRIDSLDQPARPLGAKRAAMQLRRKRGTGALNRRTDPSRLRSSCTLTSQDGCTTFSLIRTAEGLLVERTQIQPLGSRLIQSMVFANQPLFDRWCSAEPHRFDDAVLFGQLVREGRDAFCEEW